METNCTCEKEALTQVSIFKEEALQAQTNMRKRIELFKEGITQGAHQVAARHIYLAGMYSACLDNNFTISIDDWQITNAINNRITNIDSTVVNFFLQNRDLVQNQRIYLDIEGELKKATRRKKGLEGRLNIRIQNEFRLAHNSLERLKRLSEKLVTWKESIRYETRISVEKVIDMHT